LRDTAEVFDADAAADALASGEAPTFDIEYAVGVLGNLGLVEHRRGNLASAVTLLERSVRFMRDHGGVSVLATLLVRLADVLLDLGRSREARAALAEARPLVDRLGLREELEQCIRLSERAELDR
jgi:hypothetical protein